MAFDAKLSDDKHIAAVARLQKRLGELLLGEIRAEAHPTLAKELDRLSSQIGVSREKPLGRPAGSASEFERVQQALRNQGDVQASTARELAAKLNTTPGMINRVRPSLKK